MKICVVCHGYPTKKTASAVFVAKLCDEFADQGNEVTIIAPQSVSNILLRNGAFSPKKIIHKTKSGNIVRVYRPFHLTISNHQKVLKGFNEKQRTAAVKRVISRIGEQDVYYGHFWDAGYRLFSIIKETGKPLFVATGESEIYFKKKDEAFNNYVRGVICVSTKNLDESISLGLTSKSKCIVLPNAIDDSEFYKMDKQRCRSELNIGSDDFVVGYVGTICYRKGAVRLSDAIKKLEDKHIRSFFLGRTPEEIPDCSGIIRLGFTSHEMVPKYLNAADVYVLPSLAEGCSNSIVEAMACGLPIISSDLPFNYDILNSANSIMVDPNDIDAIADAIRLLKDNAELRESMGINSLTKAKELSLQNRASRILTFMKERL